MNLVEPNRLDGSAGMARAISQFDWSATELGPFGTWPAHIAASVSLILRSPLAALTLWGVRGLMIYNDAFADFAGGRHPQLLGAPVRDGWPDIAGLMENARLVCMAGGTLSYRNEELRLNRSGHPEQAWVNLDFSPVPGAGGAPAGVVCFLVETTESVRLTRRLRDNEARLRFLDLLGRETASRTGADAILATTTRMLGEHLDVSNCAYADMDPDEDGFTIRGDWAQPGAMHIVGHYSLAAFGQRAVNELGAGRPLVVNDNLRELPAADAATFQSIGIGATICMPLVKDGRLTALMAVHHQGPHAWTEDEQALVADVTERSWAHIERVRSNTRLRDSEERFRELANSMPDIVWQTDATGIVTYVNDRWTAFSGIAAAEAVGRPWLAEMLPEDRERALAAWARATETRSTFHAEWRYRKADGSLRWMLSRGEPIIDAQGRIVRWVGTDADITDSRARVDALRESEERLRLSLDAAEAGSWDYDLTAARLIWSPRLFQLFGMPSAAGDVASVDHWRACVPANDLPGITAEAERAREQRDYFRVEHRIVRQDTGETRWVRGFGQYLYDSLGQSSRFVGLYQDITDRKQAEEKVIYLMREVNHRSKNLLSVVQAIARQTAAEGDPRVFAQRFGDRLSGLAASHDLLVRNNWQGVDLSELVGSQLLHFEDLIGSRIHIAGPSVRVSATAAQSLGLALHELATNAGKYGSLSNARGSVAITWEARTGGEDERFFIQWAERDGPPVAPPVRRGLGSLLTTRITERSVEGQVSINYAATGLTWQLDAPLRNIVKPDP